MRTRTHTTGQLRPRNFIDQIVFRRTTEAAPRYDLCWLRGGTAMADTVTGGWAVHGRWILSRLKGTITALAGQLEDYDFGAATQVPPQPSPAATPPTNPHAPPHHELGGGRGQGGMPCSQQLLHPDDGAAVAVIHAMKLLHRSSGAGGGEV